MEGTRGLLRWLAWPTFASERERQGKLLHVATIIIIVLTALVAVASFLLHPQAAEGFDFWSLVVIAACLLAQRLLREGEVTRAGYVVVLVVWAAITERVITSGGSTSVIVETYYPVALLATVVINVRAGVATGVASVIAMGAIRIVEVNGRLPAPHMTYGPSISGAIQAAAILMTIGLAFMAVWLLDESMKKTRSTKASFEELVRSAPEGIVSLDKEGKILSFNPAIERMLGVRAEEVEGEVFAELGWDAAAAVARLCAPASGDSALRGLVAGYQRADGPRELELAVRPIDADPSEPNPARWRLSVRDITDKRITERERDGLTVQLHQAQRLESLGLLAGGIAHDFNNLTTVILGNAELLSRALEDGDQAEMAREIHVAGDRAAQLTQQLLAFGRKQVREPRRLVLSRSVGELQPMLRRLVTEQIELSFELGGVGAVRIDPGQLTQIVVNLVVNARDALPEGGKVVVRTADEEEGRRGQAIVSVIDDGEGMEDGVRARIFEPFFTTKGPAAGTGLGLSVVEGIVAQNDGEVRVQTELGKGTRFDVLFPRVGGEDEDEELVAQRMSRWRSRATVLLVEDEAAVRRVVRRVLAHEGYDVLVASDGEEALAVAREHGERIDVLVTDVVMPRSGGVEVANELRSERADLPVVFISGYVGTAFGVDGSPTPDAHYLGKPFTSEQLLEVISHALKSPTEDVAEASRG